MYYFWDKHVPENMVTRWEVPSQHTSTTHKQGTGLTSLFWDYSSRQEMLTDIQSTLRKGCNSMQAYSDVASRLSGTQDCSPCDPSCSQHTVTIGQFVTQTIGTALGLQSPNHSTNIFQTFSFYATQIFHKFISRFPDRHVIIVQAEYFTVFMCRGERKQDHIR